MQRLGASHITWVCIGFHKDPGSNKVYGPKALLRAIWSFRVLESSRVAGIIASVITGIFEVHEARATIAIWDQNVGNIIEAPTR